MKLWTTLASLGAVAGVCVLALSAQAASAPKHSVINSKHNVNNVFGPGTILENQVCLPCHAPHHQPDQTQDTLWNHLPSTYASYTMYPSTTTTDTTTTPATVTQKVESGIVVGLDSTSKKCLSCHDGSVAVDSYGSYQFQPGSTPSTFNNSTPANFMSGAWKIGGSGDLSHDHPVGVTYPGLTDSGTWIASGTGSTTSFNDPTSKWSSSQYQQYNSSNVLTMYNYVDSDSTGPGTGTQIYTVGGGFGLATVGSHNGNVVGCGSCHTPHSDNYNFLAIKNVNSQLCLTCHVK